MDEKELLESINEDIKKAEESLATSKKAKALIERKIKSMTEKKKD